MKVVLGELCLQFVVEIFKWNPLWGLSEFIKWINSLLKLVLCDRALSTHTHIHLLVCLQAQRNSIKISINVLFAVCSGVSHPLDTEIIYATDLAYLKKIHLACCCHYSCFDLLPFIPHWNCVSAHFFIVVLLHLCTYVSIVCSTKYQTIKKNHNTKDLNIFFMHFSSSLSSTSFYFPLSLHCSVSSANVLHSRSSFFHKKKSWKVKQLNPKCFRCASRGLFFFFSFSNCDCFIYLKYFSLSVRGAFTAIYTQRLIISCTVEVFFSAVQWNAYVRVRECAWNMNLKVPFNSQTKRIYL